MSVQTIRSLKRDIAASLFIKPASIEELLKRDFLKSKSFYGIDLLLSILEKEKWIYLKGGKYRTYKHVAKKDLIEYDLL